MGSFPYQILVVACPEVWDKAVLSQSSLIDQLNPSWVTCFHFKINVSLVFCQLWGFSTQLENNQGDTTSNSSTKQDSNSSAVPQRAALVQDFTQEICLSIRSCWFLYTSEWAWNQPDPGFIPLGSMLENTPRVLVCTSEWPGTLTGFNNFQYSQSIIVSIPTADKVPQLRTRKIINWKKKKQTKTNHPKAIPS